MGGGGAHRPLGQVATEPLDGSANTFGAPMSALNALGQAASSTVGGDPLRSNGSRTNGTSQRALDKASGCAVATAKAKASADSSALRRQTQNEGLALVHVRALQLFQACRDQELEMFDSEEPSAFEVNSKFLQKRAGAEALDHFASGNASLTKAYVPEMLARVGTQLACTQRMFNLCFDALCNASGIDQEPDAEEARERLRIACELDFEPNDEDRSGFKANSFDFGADSCSLEMYKEAKPKNKGKRAGGKQAGGKGKKQRVEPEPDSDDSQE